MNVNMCQVHEDVTHCQAVLEPSLHFFKNDLMMTPWKRLMGSPGVFR